MTTVIVYVLSILMSLFGTMPASQDLMCAGVKIDNIDSEFSSGSVHILHFSFDDNQTFVVVDCRGYGGYEITPEGYTFIEF